MPLALLALNHLQLALWPMYIIWRIMDDEMLYHINPKDPLKN